MKLVFRATLPGRAYCKKTTMRAIGAGKKKRILYSPNYLNWETKAQWVIQKAKQSYPDKITSPVIMRAVFYFENKQGEADLSALYEGVQDVLQKMGVIENDKLVYGHDRSRKVFYQEPRTEVELYLCDEQGTCGVL